MNKRWFLFFLMKSLSLRKGHVVIASVCVTLAVAAASAMIAVTAGVRGKLGEELKAYGANLIVTPAGGGYLDKRLVDELRSLPDVEDASGQILGRSFFGQTAIEIIGLDRDKLRERGWRLTGLWPRGNGEALAGINLKNGLNLEIGKTLHLESSGKEEASARRPGNAYTVTGFIERGGPEDDAVVLSLPDAGELLKAEDGLSAVLVRGTPGKLDQIERAIRDREPGVSARTIRNIALPEESLLSKIQLLMALVTGVVLFAAWVSIAATMGANVFERRAEIGLMMALGATGKEVARFYRAEAALIGLGGGLAGLLLGVLSAEAITNGAFHSLVPVPLYLPLLAPAAGLVMTLSASTIPLNNALACKPALILRGE